ncbi:zinc finger protein 467-like isoform X2 [Oncorhynchus keta]|uniref:zinc finger protein 467-like isoform X2 n=1 Tax=Oncorhynchus keta TaxID=8018 RepID=UPI00227D47A6|nr:zinc finger protein 467-like isoform X2 [Oncorhynchus keta]
MSEGQISLKYCSVTTRLGNTPHLIDSTEVLLSLSLGVTICPIYLPLVPPEQGVRDATVATMLDSVRNAFHAQLATVMDSLLAAAVCEIAKIFESSLCEQQEELMQRGGEITALRGRLERAERRLKKEGDGDDGLLDVIEGPAREIGGDDSPRQQSEPRPGSSWESDAASETPPLVQDRGCKEPPRMKKEETELEGTSVKEEFGESHPAPVEGKGQGPGGSSAAGSQRLGDPLSDTPGTKAKLSHWEGDHRPLQSQSSTSFFQEPRVGHFSPRPDHRSPGLDPWASGVPLDLQDPSFLDQSPDQVLEQREPRQSQDQTNQSQRGLRPRDDRGRGLVHQNRWSLASKDPIRPHPNTHAHKHAHGHAHTLSGARPYTCPYCGKSFSYPSHQRRHLLRHTGVRMYPCLVCDKSFLTPSELTVHTRVHTGERPFGCTQCGKRFARSGNLRAHQRDVHLGKRPFVCQECGKRFAHRGNLRVHHQRVHPGLPYHEDEYDQDGIALPSTG